MLLNIGHHSRLKRLIWSVSFLKALGLDRPDPVGSFDPSFEGGSAVAKYEGVVTGRASN